MHIDIISKWSSPLSHHYLWIVAVLWLYNDIFQSHYTYNTLKRMCTFGVKYVPANLSRWHVGTVWADIMVGDRPIKEGHR